ncbi:universal stress protein [Flavobacterium agrisoli]|uniref:Universal stress protein n=1 Tax=Flavobacterium agrisoli TaxID=2793066 RepID=A0A934PL22_9FLAO|nr:universal stress protein [Flavobacterium agrisoli]MBK0370137.1 universal stress protein [Flavobacterium agrisoli]
MTLSQTDAISILVGLDLSEIDESIIIYTNEISKIVAPIKITFLHNIRVSELPKDFLTLEKMERLKQKITAKIESDIKKIGCDFEHTVVIETASFSEIAFKNLIKKDPHNLLILGNKQFLEGSGGLSQKLIRLLPCTTLLVPETATHPIEKILYGFDFSKHTDALIRWGKKLNVNEQNQTIKHQAIYVSKYDGNFSPFISDKEIQHALQKEEQKKVAVWNNQFEGIFDFKIIKSDDKSIATVLLLEAQKQKANLLIIGKQGTSSITDLFLGSTANNLIQKPTNTALLFIKTK